jgi:hypothetical protein
VSLSKCLSCVNAAACAHKTDKVCTGYTPHAPTPAPKPTPCRKCGTAPVLRLSADKTVFAYWCPTCKDGPQVFASAEERLVTWDIWNAAQEPEPVTPARKLLNHIAELIASADYPDERTLDLIRAELRAETPEDVAAYDRAADQCRAVFIERRAQYGNHLAKPPAYDKASLYVKACRLCADHEAGRPYMLDTAIDFVNFALMLLSRGK